MKTTIIILILGLLVLSACNERPEVSDMDLFKKINEFREKGDFNSCLEYCSNTCLKRYGPLGCTTYKVKTCDEICK